jgi:hypothetical protein
MRQPLAVLALVIAACGGGATDSGLSQVDRCHSGADCAMGLYCRFPPDSDPCGANGSAGECFPATLTCVPNAPSVCGCDNKTYANSCDAWDNGHVGSLHDGPCQTN